MSSSDQFELKITSGNSGAIEIDEDDLKKNTMHKEAKGGTELMLAGLKERLDSETWDKFNFIMSRVRDEFIDEDRPNILWLQDLPEDPESEHLKDASSRERFAKIVFNSNWQQQQYFMKLGVPYEDGVVLKNCCETFEPHDKPKGDKLRLVYFSTPHRGLHILESAVRHLETQRDDFEVDVYSSFKIYGWEEQDKQFQDLYDRLNELKSVNYHGTVSNEEIRKALQTSHILAYPSTYVESSCCVAIEAMAAGLLAVVPNYGALTETCTDYAWMYNWESDPSKHAQKYAGILNSALEQYWNPALQRILQLQALYYNYFYSWDMRIAQWTSLLSGIEAEQAANRLQSRPKYPY